MPIMTPAAAARRPLRGIVKAMAKQVALADWQAIARLDMQFHTAFVAGAKNSRLIRIYETVAAEWAFHNKLLEVDDQVVAQYGRDSNEAQAVGRKKESERKSPRRTSKKSQAS